MTNTYRETIKIRHSGCGDAWRLSSEQRKEFVERELRQRVRLTWAMSGLYYCAELMDGTQVVVYC